jgi:hypothetical protein
VTLPTPTASYLPRSAPDAEAGRERHYSAGISSGDGAWTGVAVALCLIFVSFAGTLGYCKLEGLQFSTRDYSYYLQFASKLFDPSASHYFSLNPEGRNMLFMRGPDGALGLQHGIHLEPPKYLAAIAYAIFKTPLAPLVLYIVLFTGPIGWAAVRFRKGGVLPALGLALFLAFPSSLLVATDDLRPFILMAPLFLLFVLGLAYRVPLSEKIVYLTLFLFVREEAVVLALSGLAYLFLREKAEGSPHRESGTLLRIVIAWMTVAGLYFAWDGYPVKLDPARAASLAIIVCSLLVLGILVSRKTALVTARHMPVVAFAALTIAPILVALRQDALPAAVGLLYSRYGTLLCAAIVGLVVIADEQYGTRFRKFAIGAFAICAAGSLAVQFVGVHSAYRQFAVAHATLPDARLVWDVRKSLDPRATEVLVDLDVHQAFWNFEHVYAFNRLPAHLVSGNLRYPENAPQVESLLRDRINYVLVASRNILEIRRLAASAGVLLVPEKSNGSFSFFLVERPNTISPAI